MPKHLDFRKEVTEQIISLMEQGTAPWQRAWNPGISAKLLNRPYNVARDYAYSGSNAIRLLFYGLAYDPIKGDPRWCSFKEANDRGWRIKRGSKSTTVEFWKWYKADTKTDESTGKEIIGKPPKPSVFYHQVFHASQIDGIPPFEPEKIEIGWKPIEKAENILVQSGATIFFDRTEACYSPRFDEIHMPPKAAFPSPEGFYATALHELGHWTGHKNRLNRPNTGKFGSQSYAKEELRAELASLFLSMDIGIPFDPANHAAYLKSWIQGLKDDHNEFFRAARDAEKITEYVMKFAVEKSISKDAGADRKIYVDIKENPLEKEKRWQEQEAILTELCVSPAVMYQTENQHIAFTPSTKERNYQVTVFSKDWLPAETQQVQSVQEAAKILVSKGVKAGQGIEKMEGEPRQEQKRLAAILLECESRVRPTLAKIYRLQFQSYLKEGIEYREIDLKIAEGLLQDGYAKPKVQATITKNSPQAAIDCDLKYASKVVQQVIPKIQSIGKAVSL